MRHCRLQTSEAHHHDRASVTQASTCEKHLPECPGTGGNTKRVASHLRRLDCSITGDPCIFAFAKLSEKCTDCLIDLGQQPIALESPVAIVIARSGLGLDQEVGKADDRGRRTVTPVEAARPRQRRRPARRGRDVVGRFCWD